MNRIVLLRQMVLLPLVSLAVACGGDGGGGGGGGNPAAPSPTPTSTSTGFQGTITGLGESGTLEVTIDTLIATTSAGVTTVPLAASASSGSLRVAGAGGPVGLTGTYEDTTREITMLGGGFTFRVRRTNVCKL